MKSIRTLALFLCLTGLACSPGATNDLLNPTPGSDNPDGGDSPGTGPTATFTISKTGLNATFDASGVSSPSYAANAILVRWDYTNDGTYDTTWSATKTARYTYAAEGSYTVAMQMKDPQGRTDSATRYFTITTLNASPTAAFTVNMANGMTASVDASSSSDAEDALEDIRIRWDWDGDNTYDTGWSTIKTAEYTYPVAAEYTIGLQVKDLNEAIKTVTQKIIASPIVIRNSFITYGNPYMVGLHFRLVNNITGEPVTAADVPALTRAYFTVSEDNTPVDLSETNLILSNGKRPMLLALILDFTGSMYDANGVAPMMTAAKSFIAGQSDNTSISLWAFWERQGGNIEIDDFTPCTPAGKAKLQHDLDVFASAQRDRGATEIWDLLKKVVDTKFPDYDNGVNRGIVFLSDGHDTTSTTTIMTLVTAAQKKAVFMFAVGMAFRPQEYPTDEPNLKKVAEDTGGLYFTVNQVADLSTVFTQLSEDVNADWTLSYITLKSTGTHTVKTTCNYLDGYAVMTGKYPLTDAMKGDIRKGLLVSLPAPVNSVGQTEYALYANYMPRGILTLRVRVTSADPVRLTLYDADTICKAADGWTISPDVAAGDAVPADGWYALSSPTPLEYGSWGRIARCTVDATALPAVHFELPALAEQSALYGDKTIVFEVTDSTTLDVP